ncbi:hypothetical protein MHYP_G00076360 [Metynnis hypsauchen]
MMSFNSQRFFQQDSLHLTEGPSDLISHGALLVQSNAPAARDVIYIPPSSGQFMVQNQFPRYWRFDLHHPTIFRSDHGGEPVPSW